MDAGTNMQMPNLEHPPHAHAVYTHANPHWFHKSPCKPGGADQIHVSLSLRPPTKTVATNKRAVKARMETLIHLVNQSTVHAGVSRTLSVALKTSATVIILTVVHTTKGTHTHTCGSAQGAHTQPI